MAHIKAHICPLSQFSLSFLIINVIASITSLPVVILCFSFLDFCFKKCQYRRFSVLVCGPKMLLSFSVMWIFWILSFLIDKLEEFHQPNWYFQTKGSYKLQHLLRPVIYKLFDHKYVHTYLSVLSVQSHFLP